MKKKPGPKPKAKCSKGHDISKVGRSKAGNCKKCQSDYYKAIWKFAKEQYDKNNL